MHCGFWLTQSDDNPLMASTQDTISHSDVVDFGRSPSPRTTPVNAASETLPAPQPQLRPNNGKTWFDNDDASLHRYSWSSFRTDRGCGGSLREDDRSRRLDSTASQQTISTTATDATARRGGRRPSPWSWEWVRRYRPELLVSGLVGGVGGASVDIETEVEAEAEAAGVGVGCDGTAGGSSEVGLQRRRRWWRWVRRVLLCGRVDDERGLGGEGRREGGKGVCCGSGGGGG
ncbi:hypothetical protein EJ03DRAFT_379181 [Teratosphaeria nubilosa]|uniref:Uncharacterized protein n=1 Tax=Teratosphaeria nubilosa TaxID=161662 RepID=A0A6G1KTY6_9PEZI|nr:hypothetical protein EJ03DRAFT_379181 [Teratosphaeria nubilosa]